MTTALGGLAVEDLFPRIQVEQSGQSKTLSNKDKKPSPILDHMLDIPEGLAMGELKSEEEAEDGKVTI